MDPDYRARLRDALFQAVDYHIHSDEVRRFHESNARIKIVSSPARTSKSYAGWKDVLPDVFEPVYRLQKGLPVEPWLCWIVAPNYDLAKEFQYAYEDLVLKLPAKGFDYEIKRKAANAKQGDMQIVLLFGTRPDGVEITCTIEVKTAANIQSIQSEEVNVGILSEAARLPAETWSKYMATRTTRAIWPTTPSVEAYWIFDTIQRGLTHPELRIENFEFTPHANPSYRWDRFWTEHANAESRVSGHIQTIPVDPDSPCSLENGHDCFDELIDCVAMRDDAFAEQFGGRWTLFKGRVVPIRERESPTGAPAHVIDWDPDWRSFATVHVACDYGYEDNAVAGIFLIGPDGQIVLRRCVYENHLTAERFIDRIEEEMAILAQTLELPSKRAHRYVGDPKKPEVESILRDRGLPVWNGNKKRMADRHAGHLLVMELLATEIRTGMPRLLVHTDCQAIINEWRSLRRSQSVRNEGAPNSLVGADDGYDMLRYFASSEPTAGSNPYGVSEFEKARQLVMREQRKRHLQRTVPQTPGFSAPSWR